MLDTERKIFQVSQPKWLKEQPGKFVLIKDEKVVGFFSTQDEALTEGARLFGLNSFLIRQVEQTEELVYIPALSLGLLRAGP
ncbi:MAG: hypothetical protein HY083_10225 [Gammaproteobacteria bacterium]|nr:hypothetical protein [Gammaproteobacteria bacterium]